MGKNPFHSHPSKMVASLPVSNDKMEMNIQVTKALLHLLPKQNRRLGTAKLVNGAPDDKN